jgi:hypothetical protein
MGAVQAIVNRRRQRSRAMQAELDGRGQAIATPAFIEPEQLKAGVHTDDDEPPFWFAVWNVRRGLAWTLDAYLHELGPYERDLRSARRDVGDRFAGPFDSEQQAEELARKNLLAGRRDRAARSGSVRPWVGRVRAPGRAKGG